MRGVTESSKGRAAAAEFLLTRLMRGVTNKALLLQWYASISTHTPHARRDSLNLLSFECRDRFLLTRLMRGVTDAPSDTPLFYNAFLLTRLMRGVTRIQAEIKRKALISTHTPHARRDLNA